MVSQLVQTAERGQEGLLGQVGGEFGVYGLACQVLEEWRMVAVDQNVERLAGPGADAGADGGDPIRVSAPYGECSARHGQALVFVQFAAPLHSIKVRKRPGMRHLGTGSNAPNRRSHLGPVTHL